MSDEYPMDDVHPMELAEMLAAMAKIEAPPDYKAIVQKDWDDRREELKSVLRAYIKNNPTPDTLEKYKTEHDVEYGLAIIIDGRMQLDRCTEEKITKLLNGYPEEVVMHIIKTICVMDLHRLWNDSSCHVNKEIEIAKKKRTYLNATNKMLKKTLAMMGNHLLDNVFNNQKYPSIVLSKLEESIRSLEHALKLSAAYIELIDEEIAKEKGVYTTKHHPIWKTIYKPIATAIQEAQKLHPELRHESHISLTAKLMATVYPWHWGKDANNMDHRKAIKHIGAGCKMKVGQKKTLLVA